MSDAEPTIETVEESLQPPFAITGDDVARVYYVLGQAMGIARRHRSERDHYHRFATMVGEIVRLIAEDVPSIDIEVLLQDLPTIVANIRTERDRFRVAAERAREQTQDEVLSHTKTAAELDRLRAALNATRSDVSGGYPVDECVRYEAMIAHLIAERDGLRAHRDRVVETLESMKSWVPADRNLLAENARLRASVARYKAFAESEILDRVSADLGVDLRRQLEEGNVSEPDEPITRGFLRTIAGIDERVELPSPRLIELLDAEAERDKLRAAIVEACSTLDDITEATGHGSIGAVVERLLERTGVDYPVPADSGEGT